MFSIILFFCHRPETSVQNKELDSLSRKRYCPGSFETLRENPMKLADEEDRDEPDFRPKYKKVLPPGLGQRQTTSIGVGQSKGSNV